MYRMVRYEDMVSNPMAEIEELCNFIGVKFNPTMRQYTYDHFHAETIGITIGDR